MKKLLIVDDERHTVDRIASSLDWASLGIDAPLRAYDASEARRLLSSVPFDIMLCDIEMPGESGLELIHWTRCGAPDLETVIFTCHADFHYAREAIRLGSFDYLIKPVSPADLSAVMSRLIERIDHSASLRSQCDLGRQWLRNRPLVVERFWLDLIGGAIPSDSCSLQATIDDRGVPFGADSVFLPILLRFHYWSDEPSLKERRIREHEGRNSLGAELASSAGETDLVRLEKDGALAIVRLPSDDRERIGSCFAACERFSTDFSRANKCSLGCYIGESVRLSDVAETVLRLRKLAADNVSCETSVECLRPKDRAKAGFEPPDLEAWKLLLENDSRNAFEESVSSYIGRRERRGRLDANALRLLRQDVLQVVHIVLGSRGVSAHALFENDACVEGELTVPDTLRWIKSVLDRFSQLTAAAMPPAQDVGAFAAAAVRYIKERLSDDLSRETIADRIGLNADYFGRIFRKETGVTVTEFVVRERVAMAKRLLECACLSISDVAVQVGYTNFAYFSQVFRKSTGYTPSEYRKRHSSSSQPGSCG